MTPQALGRLYSHGSVRTCEIQGFLLQISVCSTLYNLSLCIYYHLVICNEWTPTKIRNSRFEWWMNAIVLLYPLSLGVVCLHYDAFNPTLTSPSWCYISEVPWDCNRMDDVECIRGNNYFWIQFGASIVPVATAVIGGIVCVVRIWIKVRNQSQLMYRKYNYSNDTLSGANHTQHGGGGSVISMSSSSMSSSSSLRPNSKSSERTRQAALQAFLYTLAFLLTYSAPIIQSFIAYFWETTAENRKIFFATSFLTVLLGPLQGLWNLLIYSRPIYNRISKQHAEYTIWQRLVAVLLGEPSQTQRKKKILRAPAPLQPIGSFYSPNHTSGSKNSIPTKPDNANKEECVRDTEAPTGPSMDHHSASSDSFPDLDEPSSLVGEERSEHCELDAHDA